MTTHPTAWLRCATPRPEARERLICFPHSGGSASFFHDWGNHLTESEVHAVQYPGRAERLGERSPTDLRQLAREIAVALEPLADRPLALFGHSMGVPIALETARCLEANGIHPSHLFASGSRDGPFSYPDMPADVEYENQDDDQVIAKLVTLGGTDAQTAEDPLFRELILPYVRSDDRMWWAHARTFELTPPLGCDVTTIVGEGDRINDNRPWSKLTRGAVREHVVPGGHFYLMDDPPYSLIRAALRPAT